MLSKNHPLVRRNIPNIRALMGLTKKISMKGWRNSWADNPRETGEIIRNPAELHNIPHPEVDCRWKWIGRWGIPFCTLGHERNNFETTGHPTSQSQLFCPPTYCQNDLWNHPHCSLRNLKIMKKILLRGGEPKFLRGRGGGGEIFGFCLGGPDPVRHYAQVDSQKQPWKHGKLKLPIKRNLHKQFLLTKENKQQPSSR